MKLAIFGATGATGRQLIEQGLAAGNEVVAYARNPAKIAARHGRLRIVEGELTDASAIEQAVSGADAVISTLGPRLGENIRHKPFTQGMHNILAAMRHTGVRRLIMISTPSAGDPNDLPDLFITALVAVVRLLLRPAYDEIISVTQLVRGSDTDWTVVRVSLLNNRPRSGRIRTGYLGRGQVGVYISRADLAAFMLNQVGDTTYLHRAPALSN